MCNGGVIEHDRRAAQQILIIDIAQFFETDTSVDNTSGGGNPFKGQTAGFARLNDPPHIHAVHLCDGNQNQFGLVFFDRGRQAVEASIDGYAVQRAVLFFWIVIQIADHIILSIFVNGQLAQQMLTAIPRADDNRTGALGAVDSQPPAKGIDGATLSAESKTLAHDNAQTGNKNEGEQGIQQIEPAGKLLNRVNVIDDNDQQQ